MRFFIILLTSLITLSLAHAQGGGSSGSDKLTRYKSDTFVGPKKMSQQEVEFALSEYFGLENELIEVQDIDSENKTKKILVPGLHSDINFSSLGNINVIYVAVDNLLNKLAESSFKLDDKTIKLLYGTEQKYGLYEFLTRQYRSERLEFYLLFLGLVSLSVDNLQDRLTRSNLDLIKTTLESAGLTPGIKLAMAEGLLNEDNTRLEKFNNFISNKSGRCYLNFPAKAYEAKIMEGLRVTLRY